MINYDHQAFNTFRFLSTDIWRGLDTNKTEFDIIRSTEYATEYAITEKKLVLKINSVFSILIHEISCLISQFHTRV